MIIRNLRFCQNYTEIASMLFLDAVPTAGNFFVVRYSFDTTDRFICIVSRCTGRPFPTLIRGVNDRPECEPDQTPNAIQQI